jgi:hypothetical protein
MLATGRGRGGGEEKFSRHTKPKLHVFDQIFLKNIEITKQITFDVNLVFTATLACTKRALFITKKGTFCSLKKFRDHLPPVPYALVQYVVLRSSYAPVQYVVLTTLLYGTETWTVIHATPDN